MTNIHYNCLVKLTFYLSEVAYNKKYQDNKITIFMVGTRQLLTKNLVVPAEITSKKTSSYTICDSKGQNTYSAKNHTIM